jgi:hypothetical protein
MNIFEMQYQNSIKKEGPLAERMRPLSLSEFVGQDHIVGEGIIPVLKSYNKNFHRDTSSLHFIKRSKEGYKRETFTCKQRMLIYLYFFCFFRFKIISQIIYVMRRKVS